MEATISVIRALSDSGRLRIFMALIHHRELCVCQIIELLELAPATVSKHISQLQTARLIESRKKGRWVYCRLTENLPAGLLTYLQTSLANSRQIELDHAKLAQVIECAPDDLCRERKQRQMASL